MELSQDKRTGYLELLFEISNVVIVFVLFLFYEDINIKSTIFLLLFFLLIIATPKSLKIKNFFRFIVVYGGVIVFFLPSASSLNYDNLSIRHIVLILLLTYPLIVSIKVGKGFSVFKKSDAIFSLLTIITVLGLLIFTAYSPINTNFAVRTNVLFVISKVIYLLILFYLLLINLRLLEVFRYSSKSIFYNIEQLIAFCSIVLAVFSSYDILKIKVMAENCIHSKYSICKDNFYDLSIAMRKKGLNDLNKLFLGERIRLGIERIDTDTLEIIELAEKMYPYNCEFYLAEVTYYNKTGMNDKIVEFFKNLPAPARKVCKNLYHNSSVYVR